MGKEFVVAATGTLDKYQVFQTSTLVQSISNMLKALIMLHHVVPRAEDTVVQDQKQNRKYLDPRQPQAR